MFTGRVLTCLLARLSGNWTESAFTGRQIVPIVGLIKAHDLSSGGRMVVELCARLKRVQYVAVLPETNQRGGHNLLYGNLVNVKVTLPVRVWKWGYELETSGWF